MNCHAADNFYCARTDLYIYVCGVLMCRFVCWLPGRAYYFVLNHNQAL